MWAVVNGLVCRKQHDDNQHEWETATFAPSAGPYEPATSPTPVIGGREEIEEALTEGDIAEAVRKAEAKLCMPGTDNVRPDDTDGWMPARALLALKAENARLQGDADSARADANRYFQQLDAALAENARLEAERDEASATYWKLEESLLSRLTAAETARDEALASRDRAMHFHRKNECPKCRKVCTQATDNDYGAGKYGVYDAACPCEVEAERDAAESRLSALTTELEAERQKTSTVAEHLGRVNRDCARLTTENEGIVGTLRALGEVDFNAPGVESWKHAACAMKDAAREAVGLAPMYDVDPILGGDRG